MKYTDRFFEFPVRIYDRFSAEQAEEKEKSLDTPMEGEWRVGGNKIPYNEIASWSDYFDSEQGPEGVDRDGFLYTLIFTNTLGSFICTWDKARFEKELDKYVEKYEKWREEEINKLKSELNKV